MSFPADAIGHHLDFQHRDHEGYFQRVACCTGCEWVAVAPGSGYGRGRQLHTEAHHHLTWRCEAQAQEDRAGLLRGIAVAVPAGLTMWAAIGWLITRW